MNLQDINTNSFKWFQSQCVSNVAGVSRKVLLVYYDSLKLLYSDVKYRIIGYDFIMR